MTKCATKFCRGRTAPRDHSPYCPKCKASRWKASSPVGYFYHKLRTSANRRGISFTLTRGKFAELWNGGMAENHGRTAFCLSVDRMDNSKGYQDDNVQLLTVSENVRKRFVPFFKTQAEEAAAIAETERAVREAYHNPPPNVFRLTDFILWIAFPQTHKQI